MSAATEKMIAGSAGDSVANAVAKIDWTLPIIVLALAGFGIVMVSSASIDFAAENYGDGWFFAKRHGIYLLLSLLTSALVASVPSAVWQRQAGLLLVAALVLLVVVLLPGVGRTVNGSQRWLSLGPVNLQVSEVAKFALIMFFASFLARKHSEVAAGWGAFAVMIGIIGAAVALLLLEPDFGSAVVICITCGAMMFVGGVRLFRFILLSMVGVAALSAMAVLSPYRWQRLVTFLDPWSDQFSSGYQLVQSLIAFGRGEWFGLGLGNSIQKLFFLPEAHTDFVFAIVAEELGFVGAVALISAFVVLVYKIFSVAHRAQYQGKLFISFVCFGIAVMFGTQAFINMGVATGLLPTKGLTLPLISYGGSSLVVTSALLAVVMRMDWELRRDS
jgi:cell division protein FtsW